MRRPTGRGRSSRSDRRAIAEGLELIRRLLAERGRRPSLDGQMDDARADSFTYDPPCPDA